MTRYDFQPGQWPRLELTPAVPAVDQLGHARLALELGLPEIRPCKPHGHRLEVAAGGPSLADTMGAFQGYVAAVNGSLGYLLEQGILPNACGVLDPGQHMADVVVADRRVRYYVASTCHPDVFEKLKDCHVTLWHPSGLPGLEDLLQEHQPETWFMLGGGSTMGTRWLNLGYALGFRDFVFHGLDSSFRDGATHAYPDRADAKVHIDVNGRRTRMNFVAQVSDFLAMRHRFQQPDIDPVTIEVVGDGLLQDTLHAIDGTDADETGAERLKYRAMWRHAPYRSNSPGERRCEAIVTRLAPSAGASLLDFGVGTGRLAHALQERGLDVRGIDIAANCLDDGVAVPLYVAPLWDLAGVQAADYGVCCDVMEHIPPGRVEAVLSEVSQHVRRACYWHISSDPDAFGTTIGKPLHLTVQPPEWWRERLGQHFARVTDLGGGDFLTEH